eukprot:1195708-Prorocentrum_minimum.AAC.11
MEIAEIADNIGILRNCVRPFCGLSDSPFLFSRKLNVSRSILSWLVGCGRAPLRCFALPKVASCLESVYTGSKTSTTHPLTTR